MLFILCIVPGCRRKSRRVTSVLDNNVHSSVCPTASGENAFDEDIEEFVLADKNELNPFASDIDSENNSGEDFESNDNEEDIIVQEQKNAGKTIYYGFNEYKITPEQTACMDYNVKQMKLALKNDAHTIFIVEGHACRSAGSDSYNMSISNRRGSECVKYLVKNNIPKASLKLVGRGSEMPLVLTGNAQAQAPNRRVEIFPISLHKTV